jgi:hypothetical protein
VSHSRRSVTRELRPLDLVIGILATFRLSRFLTSDGFPLVRVARETVVARTGKDSAWTELATCPWCQSLWAGPLVTLALQRWPRSRWLLLGPAISAGVGLLSTLDSYLGTDEEKEHMRKILGAYGDYGQVLSEHPAGGFARVGTSP